MLIFLFENYCQLIIQSGVVYIYIYIACFPGGVLSIFARAFSGLKTYINLLDSRQVIV